MSLTGIQRASVDPCDDAGGAAPTRTNSLDAYVPTWAPQTYKNGSLVKTLGADGKWTMWLSTQDHTAGAGSPDADGTGWVAITPFPTAIPPWKANSNYVEGAPVRIDNPDPTKHDSLIYIATKPITGGTGVPGTTAGQADGWILAGDRAAPEFSPTRTYGSGDLVQSPAGDIWVATGDINPSTDRPGTPNANPKWARVGTTVTVRDMAFGPGSAPKFDPATPATNDPINPHEGDEFVNIITGVRWVFADDSKRKGPKTPGWVRGQIMWHTIEPGLAARQPGVAYTAADFLDPTECHPDPREVDLQEGDVIFIMNRNTAALVAVVYMGV